MKKTRVRRTVSPATRDAAAAGVTSGPGENAGRRQASFPIVGIGASAGGLEAFSTLLAHLPIDTGMGFVLVQHLDPEHESALTHLLGRTTKMPVQEVTNKLRIEANHVYVIPPNTNLGIVGGVLTLRPRPKTRTPHRSIDVFLEALAADQRELAIGVILSGTATDGTVGLEAIKAEGGITFAQDDSARYDSMPRSAVAAGCVDFVLSPEQIAHEIARIASHPHIASAATEGPARSEGGRAPVTLREPQGRPEHGRGATAHDDDTPLPAGGDDDPDTGATRAWAGRRLDASRTKRIAEDGFRRILRLLRNHSGVDFSLYKSNTIERRITRRLVLTRHDTLDRYAQFLRGNARELDALYSDVLISVTSFFRNPDAFDVLRRKVLTALLLESADGPIRVWVLGCSTGQEAYSIAMAFVEAADKAPLGRRLQVFATDLNDALLDKARHGLYAKSIAQDVPPERLRRFFVEEEGGYRVGKALREMVVFARQNVIGDPPFSRMDLISCRNLLIYLEPELQKKVFPVFHYALKPGGFLYLGASESIGTFTELFEPVDKKHKIYAKKAAATPAFQLPARKKRDESGAADSGQTRNALRLPAGQGGAVEGVRTELNAQREADRVTVQQFAPPAVLVSADLQILQFRGPTGAYLELPTGKATLDVLKMARNGLMLPLRTAINKARKDNKTVRSKNVRLEQNGAIRVVSVQVIPLKNLREPCFLIVFEEAETPGPSMPAIEGAPSARPDRQSALAHTARAARTGQVRRIAELETDLAETRDYLQSMQEQHEAANEELQASNEEVQSANEELQSINEELETSKEELESANEELTTINEEMANRNAELNRLNSDLLNVQSSAGVALILLGRDLTIRRFSAQAEKQFNLLAADVGRPLASVRLHLDLPDLDELVADVIDTMRERELEVQDQDGRWFSLRVRPYVTIDNKVDGAVLVLVDTNDLKRSEQALAAERDYVAAILRTTRDPLLILDADLRVHTANAAFYRAFGVSPSESEGRLVYELGNRQWNIPRLRELLEDVLQNGSVFDDFEVTHDFEGLGRRTMLLNARRLNDAAGQPERTLLGIQDVTAQARAESEVRDSEQRFSRFMEHLPGLAWIKDSKGRYVYANDAAEKAFGTERDTLYGKTDHEIFPPETAARFVENDRQALANESSIQTIETLEHEDGVAHQSIVSKFSIPGPDGLLAGGVAIDITELKEAEAALRRSEERYRTLFASIDEGFCVIEKVNGEPGEPLDFRYVEANPAFATQSGVDDVVGKTIRQAFPGEPEEWFLTYDAILRTGQPIRFERGLVTQGRVLELYAFRVNDDTRRRVAVIFKDITARKQAEEAQAKLAAIVESSDDAIVSKTLDGIITSWNRAAERLFGYTAREAAGQSIRMLIPAERSSEEDAILEHIRRAEVVEPFETVRRRKDGTLIDVSITVSPIRDSHGHVVGASKIARDITERRRVEQVLLASEERLRLAQQVSKVGSFDWNVETGENVWTVELEAVYGLPPGGFPRNQSAWEELVHPDDRAAALAAVDRALATGESTDGEWRVVWPDGSVHWLAARFRAIKDQSGKPVRVTGVNLDITERKLAEEALHEADRRKDEFLAMLAHELRNPLAPILVSLDILRRSKRSEGTHRQDAEGSTEERVATRLDPTDPLDHTLGVLERQVGHMVRLVDDLLDAGRISRGRIDLRRKRVELSSVVHHAVEAARPLAERRGLELTVALPAVPVYVNADPTRLAQIVGNLLNNACKFTDRGGRIWLTVDLAEEPEPDAADAVSKRLAPEIVIRVRDTGVGIAPDRLDGIFDMFTQIDGSLERETSGLGIGLTLVRTLADLHGGTVEASSPGIGHGSEFVVRLPTVTEAAAPKPLPPVPEPAATPLRILVVDDNRDAAESLAVLLRLGGHETYTACDGLAAVDGASRLDPDVILLDIGLPQLNGYDAARRIREQQPARRRPVLVALTGWGEDEDRRQSEEAGFDVHLVKPVDVGVLGRLLAELGGNRDMEP